VAETENRVATNKQGTNFINRGSQERKEFFLQTNDDLDRILNKQTQT
jgi:hypothetical protein